jgi:hypothetical protein
MGQYTATAGVEDDEAEELIEVPKSKKSSKSKRVSPPGTSTLKLTKVGRKTVLSNYPGPVKHREYPRRARKVPVTASLRLAIGASNYKSSPALTSSVDPRFREITFIIRLEWQKHGTEVFDDTIIAIGDWEYRSDPDSWGFELYHPTTKERMKFITKWYDVQRLRPCVACDASRTPSSKCSGHAPCKECAKKGIECVPQKRAIPRDDYRLVSFYGNGDTVVTDQDLYPLGSLEGWEGGVAETIRLHTIKTGDISKAVVLSNLPCPRDLDKYNEGKIPFDFFPEGHGED